jgi:hypothetical protein
MKKIIYSLFSISMLLFLFTACDDEVEIWESSTGELDGNWYVSYDHSQYGEDPFGVGLTMVHTYNTAADNGQEIWLTDEGNFWEYKVKIPASPLDLTFGGSDPVTSVVEGYDIQVRVTNGKVIKGAVKLPSGVMADSIYFEIWFEDLVDATGIENDTLYVSGFRQTGFQEDEPH